MDRSKMIRIAASLSKGSKERRKILSSLRTAIFSDRDGALAYACLTFAAGVLLDKDHDVAVKIWHLRDASLKDYKTQGIRLLPMIGRISPEED